MAGYDPWVPSEFATVDDYISSFPSDVREALETIRGTVRRLVPGAEEAISYGIAGFRLDGHMLLYIAGWKEHVGMYPLPTMDEELTAETARYKKGKGTLRFPLAEPLPMDLIERLVLRYTDRLKLKAD